MTYLANAYRLAKQAEALGNQDAARMAWQAHGFFDTAADFRKIRNQHPVAKAAHAKGVRLFRKAEAMLDARCPVCAADVPGYSSSCPNCGFEMPDRC